MANQREYRPPASRAARNWVLGGVAVAVGIGVGLLARPRNVVLEFESFEQAKRYYHSAEYQAAKAKRDGPCLAEFVIVEGAE